MALFQKTILDKFLRQQNKITIDEKWKLYTSKFKNIDFQEQLRTIKEEEYQDGFLKDLFVDVLGYVIKPNANYNLVREHKNVKDAKKADGAVVIDGKTIAVIELKDAKTIDLNSVQAQAFGYKNNQIGCPYVITSNFQKIRFYIDNAVEYQEFDLFTLDREMFEQLYLCLAFDNIKKNIPLKVKSESINQETDITKQLYKDYSAFKRALFEDLCNNNPDVDKIVLFKKSQKLLDRFLFIFFAEDSQLLPADSIDKIIKQWGNLIEMDEYKPLYERFKKYFGYMNTGYKGKHDDIFAYNGGLFKPDDVLDNIIISDDVLSIHTQKLAAYNFVSEVDVNILGHIFENSLSEIEEMQAELEGHVIDKAKSKRKKDGVFYTPRYITNYIVQNTVGKLCFDKKSELQINEEDYFTDKKRKANEKKALLEKLKDYRTWLLSLTICDPACGSGAFLNAALDFLIKEHALVDEMDAKIIGRDAMVFPNVENTILENNLFGVDINEESIEIAKLSLWLRTAKPGRKLNSLNDNIKCGNSLISDPEVGGEKAFDWATEFPKVFEKGGFDVVIGNPPYVRLQGLKEGYSEETRFYAENYVSATANYDIYALFLEKAYYLINNKGVVSWILPHKFLIADFGEGIRSFFAEKRAVSNIVHFGSEMVFADASTYTCIINYGKQPNTTLRFKRIKPLDLKEISEWDEISYENLSGNNWDLQGETVFNLIEKLKKQPFTIETVFDKIFQGIATSLDDIYVFEGIDNGDYISIFNSKYDYRCDIERGLLKPMKKGNEVSRYVNLEKRYYVIFPYIIDGEKPIPMTTEYIQSNFPKGFEYLKRFEKELKGRERGKMDLEEGWFLYIYPKSLSLFQYPKIMTQEISLGCNMTFDDGTFYHNTKVYSFVKKKSITVSDKSYLAILNSKVMWFFLKNTGTEFRGGYFCFKTNYLKPFPLPDITEEEGDILEKKADQMLTLNAELQGKRFKFLEILRNNFPDVRITGAIETFDKLDFVGFVSELGKQKIKLSLKQQDEWSEYFNEYRAECQRLTNEIARTDKEIDQMVYELYNLTEEEINYLNL